MSMTKLSIVSMSVKYQKLLATTIISKIEVPKQMNDRSDTEREGVAYVYGWILPDKYKTAEY